MRRADEVRLFDFMAGQAKAFSKTAALTEVGLALNNAALAASYCFLGQQRWNPSAHAFLDAAQTLDAQVAERLADALAASGLQPARLNDMTRMRYQQLCAA